MSKDYDNETLRQQKKAQKDFLELKMMQNGKMDAGPKPSEVAIMPKTFSEKLKNIWFHNKWHIIIVFVLIAAIIFFTTECVNKTEYDATVVVFTYTFTGDNNCQRMGEYLKPYCKDITGDGEVNISVINCSINFSEGNTKYSYTARAKLQTMIASESSALLFITDPDSYDYLSQLGGSGLLEDEPIVFDKDFYEFCKTDDLFVPPENAQISCRKIEGTAIENDKNIQLYYKQAKEILNGLKEKYE